MKFAKILILLILITLSNCISNLNYSNVMKRHLNKLQRKGERNHRVETEESFIEKNMSEKENIRNKNEDEEENESKEIESENERKDESTLLLETRSSTATKSQTETNTKFVPLILMGILLVVIVAKLIFTYIEKKYKSKLLETLKDQTKYMKKTAKILKRNEIQTCTFTTLIVATNKEIIMHYKLKIIYLKAYTEYFSETNCNQTDCENLQGLKQLACEAERDTCENFVKIKYRFSDIQNNLYEGIGYNMKILRSITSNSCNQNYLYSDFNRKIPELEKRITQLESELESNTFQNVYDIFSLVFNSIKLGITSDSSLTHVSFYDPDHDTPSPQSTDPNDGLTKTFKKVFSTARLVVIEEPYQSFNGFLNAYKDKFNKDKNKDLNKKIFNLEDYLKKHPMKEKITESDYEIDENKELKIKNQNKKETIHTLVFINAFLDLIRIVLSIVSVFEMAINGVSVVALIEGIFNLVIKIIDLVIAYLRHYSELTPEERQNKTQKWKKSYRKLWEAWAKVMIAIAYLVFSPINAVLKGTYEAVLKFIDMQDAIKQFKVQVKEKMYYDNLGEIKLRHSLKLKGYNICEAKFYGYKNILTIINAIIKDEIEMVKHKNFLSYNIFWNEILKNEQVRENVKEEIKQLCSENVQFCSHSLSELNLTRNYGFTDDEMKKLKKEAIYGPYSFLSVASNLKEFKSFINLGYEPITSTEYFFRDKFDYNYIAEEKIETFEKFNTILMGCRLCSRTSVIRHVEIMEFLDGSSENIDPHKILDQYKKNNPDFHTKCPSTPSISNHIVCKCIYDDSVCLTKKIKSIRISQNKVLYFEIVPRIDEQGKELSVYPGLDRIMLFWDSLGIVQERENKNVTNQLKRVKINVGLWSSVKKLWAKSCKRNSAFCDSNQNLKPIYEKIKITLYKHRTSLILHEDNPESQDSIEDFSYSYPILAKEIAIYEDDQQNKYQKNHYFYLKYEKTSDSGKFYSDEKYYSLNYNWIFYTTKEFNELIDRKKIVPDFYDDNHSDKFKYNLNYKGRFTSISFPPFKPKMFQISDFTKNLENDCFDVCRHNVEDAKDFNECPSMDINYNYIVNKKLFNKIDEGDHDSFVKVLENKNDKKIYNNLYKHFKLSTLTWELKVIKDDPNLIQTENLEKTIFEINSKDAFSNVMEKMFKGQNVDITNMVNYYENFHPNIFMYRFTERSRLRQFISSLPDIEKKNVQMFRTDGYILIEVKNTEDSEGSKNMSNKIFVKPLPDLGYKKSPLYGKEKCLLCFLKNYKLFGPNDFLKIEELKNFAISTSNGISTYDNETLGFFTLLDVKNKNFKKRKSNIDPLKLFKFDEELGDLIFKKTECKNTDFSFSIPMIFSKKNKYMKIKINDKNEIEEYNDFVGPGVHEIYWLQFSKFHPEKSQDSSYLIDSEKNGYFPFTTIDYDMTYLIPQDFLTSDELKKYNKLTLDEKKIYVTIWVATDFRHSFKSSELCDLCNENKKLMADFESLSKDGEFFIVDDIIENTRNYLTRYSYMKYLFKRDKEIPSNYPDKSLLNLNGTKPLSSCFNLNKCNFAEYLNLFRDSPKYVYNNTPLPEKLKFILSQFIEETKGRLIRPFNIEYDAINQVLEGSNNYKEFINQFYNDQNIKRNIVAKITRDIKIENINFEYGLQSEINNILNDAVLGFYLYFLREKDSFLLPLAFTEDKKTYQITILLYEINPPKIEYPEQYSNLMVTSIATLMHDIRYNPLFFAIDLNRFTNYYYYKKHSKDFTFEQNDNLDIFETIDDLLGSFEYDKNGNIDELIPKITESLQSEISFEILKIFSFKLRKGFQIKLSTFVEMAENNMEDILELLFYHNANIQEFFIPQGILVLFYRIN